MTTRKLDLLRTGYRGACKAYQTHAKVIDETARRVGVRWTVNYGPKSMPCGNSPRCDVNC